MQVQAVSQHLKNYCFTATLLSHKLYLLSQLVAYSEYVRTFKWESLKYPTKRSLNELTVAIQKGVHQKDEQIRKNMDEYTGLKNRIAGMTKKDTGSLQIRDFTDELYNTEKRPELFVEHFESQMFENLLLVINNEKLAGFQANLEQMMNNYYAAVDNAEKKKVRDNAKNKFNDIMRNHKKFVAAS